MKQKLIDLCDIQYGFAFNSAEFTDNSSYPPLIRIRDVKRGYSETFYAGKFSDEYIVRQGDLLVGMDGEFNIARWKSQDALLNQRVCRIIAKSNTDEEYLRFALSIALKKLENKTAFVTVKHLSAKELNKLVLNVPSLSDQQIKAKILSKIEYIISRYHSEIQKLDDLVKSRFMEMFGDPVIDTKHWGQKPLKEMLESIRYGTSTPPKFSDEGYAFIRATNIKNGKIVSSDMKFISQIEADRLEKCKLSGGEIIIVRSGVNAGDTCVVTSQYVGQYAGYDIILVLNEFLNPVFLNTLINTAYMEKVVKPMTRRAAQPHLNSEQTQSFPIICVPRDLQDQFAAFVREVDKSRDAIQKSLDETQVLFDSLMQEYFG